ncbi:hypothetical protein ACFL9T_10920 [Thermodesulfobacteriota bacterium]
MIRIPFLTIFFVLIQSQPAMANDPPGAQSGLAVIIILPIMIILTLVGGGYAALKGHIEEMKNSGKKTFLPRSLILKIFGALILSLFSFMNEGMTILVALIFGIAALERAIKMIMWGIRSLPGRQRPQYLEDRNPKRLVTAGVLLLVVSAFLMVAPLALFGSSSYYVTRGWMGETRDKNVRNLVAYQMAISRLKGLNSDAIASIRDEKLRVKTRIYRTKLESGKGVKDFKLYVIPIRFPFFPYHYLVSQPTYLADETGGIRMIYVHKTDQCPPDAPVVMKVTEKDIQEKLNELK